jgi:hypothetical protein
MLLSNLTVRNILLVPYIIFGIPYLINIIKSKDINTTVSKKGHLVWNNMNIIFNGMIMNHFLFFLFIFLLLFSFFYEGKIMYLIFGFITLMVFLYKEYNSAGSMWCWIMNSISMYLLTYILFYLPLKEKGIC